MAFDAGSILAKIRLDISQWEKSAREINKSQQKMAGQTKKTSSAFKGMWKQMAIGMGVTNLVSRGIREIGRQISDTIKKGRAFEREWANVTTMLNVSKSATDKMRHELRMLSPTLGSTTELAKGMYQVLSASIEPAKAIEFLGEAAKSAKAGVTETKVAVDALTTVINAYGMEAEDVTEVSDIMFQTVKRGKVTYGELATSLGTVVPIAATTGVKFREIAAAVATMTRMGIDASKATMQLRQVLMSILTPSAEAEVLAEDLGITFGANALETKGLAGWLAELREKTKGNVDQMKVFIPNARALTAVMALAGVRAEEYTEDLEGMVDVIGNTDEAFRKQMKSIDFWIETFEVFSDKIKEAIYEGLVYSLRESIDTSEEFDEKVTQATNNAANATSLHVSMMVENLQWLGKNLKNVTKLFPMTTFITGLITGKSSTDELAEAQEGLNWALARAGKFGKDLIPIVKESGEVTEKTSDKVKGLYERYQELYQLHLGMPAVWESLKPPSELMARWDEFYELVETPELDLIWEQQMSSMEEDTLNFMASIIPGMAFMTKKITKDAETMGKNTKLTFTDMAIVAGNVLTAIAGKSKGLAVVGAVISTYAAAAKTLQTFGWPAAIPFMAAAIAAGLKQVAMIKGQTIPSAEKGAYLTSPTIIEAGHGPMGEVILPLDKAPPFGGAKVDFNFYAPIISSTGISERDMDDAAEYFLRKMEEEVERYGGKLNG